MDQEQNDSFIVVGGANPDEETKESESVIFYRNRPNYDRYREEDDDNDPEGGVPATSSFVYFSEDEDEDDDAALDSWGRRRPVVPPYLSPSELGQHSNLVPPASFDISEASTIIVREDPKDQPANPYEYTAPAGEQRSGRRLPESVPVEFDQTVVVFQDPAPSFVSDHPDQQSSPVSLTPQIETVERSRLDNSSLVDGKPPNRCGLILLAVAVAVIMLGGGGGAAVIWYLSSTDSKDGSNALNAAAPVTITSPTIASPTTAPYIATEAPGPSMTAAEVIPETGTEWMPGAIGDDYGLVGEAPGLNEDSPSLNTDRANSPTLTPNRLFSSNVLPSPTAD